MKIDSSHLQLAASHSLVQQHTAESRLEAWGGARRPTSGSPPALASAAASEPAAPQELLTLSSSGPAASDESKPETDPQLTLLRTLIEMLTGRKLDVFDASELDGAAQPATEATANPSAGFGLAYDYHETYAESESTAFAGEGEIRTADGKTLHFNVQLAMSRSFVMQSDVSLRLGDAAKKSDPLVLNFAGNAAQLSDQRFSFDLNADGRSEQINFVTPGSGFLVFDRNNDGKVNDGHELFGPQSNDGFAELAHLDSDGNGWIDENDPAFAQLRIWTGRNGNTDTLQNLKEANVGALALAHVATPFELRSNANRVLGQIRTSGIFLHETGQAGTMQQIDLTT